jgi:putative phosphoesterase
MRVAVISDIHGNCVALDAVLADLEQRPADQIVCLGDAIQGGPQPAQVVARLRAMECQMVMGNADAWLLSGEETGSENIAPERMQKMQAIRQWSLGQLSQDDQAFVGAFRPTITVTSENGRQLLCFHGSPTSFDDIILPSTPEEEFQRYLGKFSSSILTGGHTHLQQIRRIADSYYFNPGSVGFAYRHGQSDEAFRADPWAEYAVLSLDEPAPSLEFRRVPFDVAELVSVYLASGRPYADEAAAQYDGRS